MDDKLCEFINKVFENAHSANETLCNLGNVSHNFKKIYVTEIDFTNDLYKYIVMCQMKSNQIVSTFIYDLYTLEAEGFEIRSRVKAVNSIQYKITNYQNKIDKDLNCGKYNLLKVLNDIIGFRIIMKNPPPLSELENFCKISLGSRARAIVSEKSDYKANHLYTKISNCMLPWEIQIWDAKYKASNLESHEKYKQEYVTWEKEQQTSDYLNKEV